MNGFSRISFDELCSRICEKKRTLIVYNVNSNADAVASAFALKELLGMMGIPAFCACSNEVPEKLRFICESLQGSVLLDEELLKDHDQVISIGAQSYEELGEIYSLLRKNIDLMIDVHPSVSPFADHYLCDKASSLAEVVFDIAKALKERGRIFEIYSEVLSLIYTGLAAATNCFASSVTNQSSHLVAAELIGAGVDTTQIHNLLFANKDIKQIKAESEVAHRLNFYAGGKIAISSVPYSSKYSLGLSDLSIETAAELPFSIFGVEISALIYQPQPNGCFKVFLRLPKNIDIRDSCGDISGARITGNCELTVTSDMSINDLERSLSSVLKRLLNNN